MARPTNALGIATILADDADHDFYLYRQHDGRWEIESCRQVTKEAFYRIRPTGRITFHLSNLDRKGAEVS